VFLQAPAIWDVRVGVAVDDVLKLTDLSVAEKSLASSGEEVALTRTLDLRIRPITAPESGLKFTGLVNIEH